jgi:anti-sigma regulatory factor (Ser/Thr protein kinase)
MPLGLMPGMTYEETEGSIGAGEGLLLYSDGLVEAHAADGEMYGFPRLRAAFASSDSGTPSGLVDHLLDDLHAFTGSNWEQEDDLTLVALRRSPGPATFDALATSSAGEVREPDAAVEERLLLDLEIPGEIGNERIAMDRVAAVVAPLALPSERLDRLRTAVSEAAMNAIEHGSKGRADVPIRVRVTTSEGLLQVRVMDARLGGAVPLGTAEIPDLEAKLAGEQKPRGWGLFLIEAMVDDLAVEQTPEGQEVVLTLDLKGAS